MALAEFTKDVAVIQKLGTFPNADDGLSEEELKKKFDEAPEAIKKYLNENVVPVINDLIRDMSQTEIFWVVLEPDGAGGYAPNKDYAQILAAHKGGKAVYCLADTFLLPLIAINEGVSAAFHVVNGRDYTRVIIRADDTVTFSSGRYILAGDDASSLPALRINVQEHNGQWSADETMEDILVATNSGRDVCCAVDTSEERLLIPLVKMTVDTLYFGAVCDGAEWLVTIGPNGVHVETKENQGTVIGQEIVLTDRATGQTYTLFVEDENLHIEPGGSVAAAHDSVTLIDRTDGGKYVIYVSDGHTMIESEA